MMPAFFHTHRAWLRLLTASLVLLLVGQPIFGALSEWAEGNAAAIARQRVAVQESERRFQDDMRLAQTPEGQLSAEDIDRLLAPVDRLRLASGLERQAASARLSHFTYVFTPERPAHMEGLDVQTLTQSDVTLAADAPMDGEALNFLRSLSYTMPGRLRLKHLVLTRAASDATVALANLHMEAELEWLSNGSAAGAP